MVISTKNPTKFPTNVGRFRDYGKKLTFSLRGKLEVPDILSIGAINATIWSYFIDRLFIHAGVNFEVPTLFKLISDVLLISALYDTWFFFVHKTLHHPKLYGLFHKKHHKWKAPIAWEGAYFTLFDFYIGNYGPLFFCSVAATNSFYSIATFGTLGMFSVPFAHCGYDIRPFHDPRIHDAHHEFFNYNFSTFKVWDIIFGTYLSAEEAERMRQRKKKKIT